MGSWAWLADKGREPATPLVDDTAATDADADEAVRADDAATLSEGKLSPPLTLRPIPAKATVTAGVSPLFAVMKGEALVPPAALGLWTGETIAAVG